VRRSGFIMIEAILAITLLCSISILCIRHLKNIGLKYIEITEKSIKNIPNQNQPEEEENHWFCKECGKCKKCMRYSYGKKRKVKIPG